jgi:hypothetical protein
MNTRPNIPGIPIGRSLPKRTCYWRYLKYVFRHKWYVLLECKKLNMLWVGIVHDLSKFSIAEWKAYAEWFQSDQGHKFKGESPEHERMKAAFQKAWEHHWKNNQHHWEYWVVNWTEGLCNEMPKNYVIEMVADWKGTGRAQGHGDDVVEWFEKNQGRLKLHPATWVLVEKLVYAHAAYNAAIDDLENGRPCRERYSAIPIIDKTYKDTYRYYGNGD